MNIIEHEHPFPYLLIDDIFESKHWKQIVFELEWLRSGNVFQPPSITGTARHADGTEKSSKTGFFLEDFYKHIEVSPTHKLVHDYLVRILNGGMSGWFFQYYKFIDFETAPLVSYYEESDYYEPHTDDNLFTFLFWYYDEPKQFDGGELIFTDYDIKIEMKPNSGVIFPGPIRHEVTEITNCSKGKGRFAVSTFVSTPNLPENQ